jgi:NAD+ diphosphatase
VASPNTFEGARLDRVTTRRRDADWVAERLDDPASRAVVLADAAVLVEDERLALVELPGLLERGAEPLLLGVQDGRALFAVDADSLDTDALAPAALVSVRDIAPRLAQDDGGLIAYAAALLNWHRRHRFCSVCGNASRIEEAGLLRRCPVCGADHHPRTDPVVIMLVVDEERDRVLLGRQPSWPPGRYSALAGFVEPGESLEDAVAREVLEESGVEVADARYDSSQPWPFPSSLMLGFTVSYVAGEAVATDGELEDARWFTRAELSEAAAGHGETLLPPPVAIARTLIDAWLSRPRTDGAGTIPGPGGTRA